MSVALRGYFDGSGQRGDPATTHLTLAGYVGTPAAWDAFERNWSAVLAQWSCGSLHTTDAMALRGAFSVERGWTLEKVRGLTRDLFNRCISPLNAIEPTVFGGTSCTVSLADFERFCAGFPDSRYATDGPEALCVDVVVGDALRMLPEDKSAPHGKRGQVEMFFDSGERFFHKVNRVWIKHKRDGFFKHIAHMALARTPSRPGLQAADMLGWHARRGFERKDLGSKLWAFFAALHYPHHYDYDALVKQHTLRATSKS